MNRQRVETAVRTASAPPPERVPAAQLPLATPMPNGERSIVQVHSEPVKLYPPKIAKALLEVARKIQPVEKAGVNDFHKYAYPKWEDIRDNLWPLINAAGLIVVQNEISKEGLTTDMIAITYSFTILNEDGDVWPVPIERTAICKIRDNKGVLDDKAASKCGTQAEKNAMVQLFKIRTEDVYEVDQEGKVHRNSPRRRQVPAPDGKLPPHYVEPTEDDTVQTWVARFIGFIRKVATVDELDQWDEFNGKVLDRVKERDGALYNTILDAMEAREKAITGKPARVVAPPPPAERTFPADRPAAPVPPDDLDIPAQFDRRERKPADDISDKDRDWLMAIEQDFSDCSTMEELTEQQLAVMAPHKETVTGTVWNKAVDTLNKHIERINQ